MNLRGSNDLRQSSTFLSSTNEFWFLRRHKRTSQSLRCMNLFSNIEFPWDEVVILDVLISGLYAAKVSCWMPEICCVIITPLYFGETPSTTTVKSGVTVGMIREFNPRRREEYTWSFPTAARPVRTSQKYTIFRHEVTVPKGTSSSCIAHVGSNSIRVLFTEKRFKHGFILFKTRDDVVITLETHASVTWLLFH